MRYYTIVVHIIAFAYMYSTCIHNGSLTHYLLLTGEGGLEVAVTASAHPVSLSFVPEAGLQFSPGPINHAHTQQLTLTNNSDTLPITFNCRVPAHYKVSLRHGKIPPQKSASVEVTFLPHQMGCLVVDGKLCVDVLERENVVVETEYGASHCRTAGQGGREEKEIRSKFDLAASTRPAVVSGPGLKTVLLETATSGTKERLIQMLQVTYFYLIRCIGVTATSRPPSPVRRR